MSIVQRIIKRPWTSLSFTLFTLFTIFLGYQIGYNPPNQVSQNSLNNAGGIGSILKSVAPLLGLYSIALTILHKNIDFEIEREVKKQKKSREEQLDFGEKIKFEFLSLLYPEIPIKFFRLQIPTTKFDNNQLDQKEKMPDIEESLKKNAEDSRKHLKAVNYLLADKDVKKDNEKIQLLEAIVNTALKEKGITKDKDPHYYGKKTQIYAYLRAWLVCSIRYQTNQLPIDCIEGKSLSLKELKDLIECVKNLISHDKKMKELIDDSDSRDIIICYLDKLIEKIKPVSSAAT